MPPAPSRLSRPRVDLLAARVRWLDRYRRWLAIAASVVLSPSLVTQLGHQLGAELPGLDATVLSLILGVLVWWFVEVGLVYVTALWETEYYQLSRDRGLPRAILRRPGRWFRQPS